MTALKKLFVNGTEITVIDYQDQDYISLTDMVKGFGDDSLTYNWMRNRNTVEFLGIWEKLYNVNFKGLEFETFKSQAGLNSFHLTPKKWIDATGAIGIISKAGRNGGTYAHRDIAFEFGTWLSAEFKLLLIREFTRLKEEELALQNNEWDYRRLLTKANYAIHTDAIKKMIIPSSSLPEDKQWLAYAEEADILNVALFESTAKQWRDKHPDLAEKNINIRDLANVHELIVLSNIENLNAEMIRKQIGKYERLLELRKAAVYQLTVLKSSVYTEEKLTSPHIKKLQLKERGDKSSGKKPE